MLRVLVVLAAASAFAVAPSTASGARTGEVPQALPGVYTKMDQELQQLIDQVQAGAVASKSDFKARLNAILDRQTNAFATLFPSVWGCKFNHVFAPLASADSSFDDEIRDQTEHPSTVLPWLGYAELFLSYAHDRLTDSCSTAPSAVRSTLAKISADAGALHKQAKSGVVAGAQLVHQMTELRDRKDALVRSQFPTVFGIPYAFLLQHYVAIDEAALQAGVEFGVGGKPIPLLEKLKAEKQQIEKALHNAATTPGPTPTKTETTATTTTVPAGPECSTEKTFPVYSVPPGYTESTNDVFPHVPPKIVVFKIVYIDDKTGQEPGPHPFPGESWTSKVDGYQKSGKFQLEVDVTGTPYGNQNTSVDWTVHVDYKSPRGCPK